MFEMNAKRVRKRNPISLGHFMFFLKNYFKTVQKHQKKNLNNIIILNIAPCNIIASISIISHNCTYNKNTKLRIQKKMALMPINTKTTYPNFKQKNILNSSLIVNVIKLRSINKSN